MGITAIVAGFVILYIDWWELEKISTYDELQSAYVRFGEFLGFFFVGVS